MFTYSNIRSILRNSTINKMWRWGLTRFGDIMVATQPPKVRGADIRNMLDAVMNGDIILRGYSYYLDSYIIPGDKYSHSGIVYDSRKMIHAIAEGVSYIDPIDFIKDCDRFAIIRPNYQSYINRDRALLCAEACIGMPYDFLFSKESRDSFYCHELVYTCLAAGDINIQVSGEFITADDIKKSGPIVLTNGETVV